MIAVKELNRAKEVLTVSLTGYLLLDNPTLNKGSAFSEEERRAFGLLGLLPSHTSTLDEQLARAYENYRRKETDVERYVFLVSLQDRNETLFYRLLQEHITEMMPIIYTPTVGAGCQSYSHLFRRPRGLYISYPSRDEIDAVLANAPNAEPAVIVVTDGERILGLGDLGVGGMGIPVGKLSLYTLCAGIHPRTTLPILLDVGTDNRELLADPLYLGWRHERVRGADYDAFIEAFVAAVMRRFPDVLLQWEDFAKDNAARLLERYRDRLCTFNDDIQGTGAVTLAGLLAATKAAGGRLGEQRIVILGAGSAAHGISDQIVAAMGGEGLTQQEARSRLWLLDSRGLVHSGRAGLEAFKQKYAQPSERLAGWESAEPGTHTLSDVVKNVRPTVLIGTSAQAGAFTEAVVREMARHVERPVIFPLSNPTSKSEATPRDLIEWTEGRALVATGSPFPEVEYGARRIRTGQCNNSFIFPGVGLGVLASGARRVTDEMFVAAARVLAALSPALSEEGASLYPPLESVREVSRLVALAVGREAQRSGLVAASAPGELEEHVDRLMWTPHYVPFVRPETAPA
ncbi:MAG TPA: NAD-dependent malic enzyme [Pyrinomonadaceae bacterium]|jgi:malate dehydrogenase (oxaloacetate-decarboxylating)|nr:NAD-dependent malic enzyme [Pyrinomonadaceae bacterium]